MNFLSLSLTQVMLLAGLTAATVFVLFFLKLRHRRVVVGSALLWNRVLDEQQANSLLEKLRRLASLLLTLTIALLIALAIGRPHFDSGGTGTGPLVLVLDTSPSMDARSPDGTTRWTLARERARGILESVSPPGGYMVADTAGRVHTQVTSDRNAALEALDAMRPFPGNQLFPALPQSEADVYFITDGVGQFDIPDPTTEVSVFQAADNVAITAFEIRVDPTSPSGFRAFLEVTNYSDTTREVPVLLSGAGDQREAWRLELGAGVAWQDEVDLSGFQGGALRVRIEAEGDGLELDDMAYAYLPVANSIRVDLVTPRTGSYLETLLGLSPRVDLRVVRPAEFEDDAGVDAFVFDGFVPETAPSNPAIVFGAAEVDWLPSPGGMAYEQAISFWEPDHEVMRQVPVYDVSIDQTTIVDPGGWTVLAATDVTPLIVADEGAVRRVLVSFSLEDSDFALHLGFPILVENMLAWTSGEALAEPSGLGRVMIGAEADLVTMLDGTEVAANHQFGQTVIEADQPELYTATIQGRRMRVAANLLDRSASDVNRSRLPGGGFQGSITGGRELWVMMLLAASLLAALEWWTYHRRITL